MPDFDQRRQGLANNGSNHCVPTAHSNMLAYIADHGFEPLFPGVTVPTDPTQYGEITDHIMDLGVMMSTSGTDGTTGTGKQEGFNQWMGASLLLFNVNYQAGPEITPWDLHWALQGGGLCAFSYGRYEFSSALGFWDRQGGHCVTLRGVSDLFFPAQPNNVNPLIKYRDPASDEGNVAGRLTGQSVFATSQVRIRRSVRDYEGYGQVGMWQMLTDSTDGRIRIIDGFTSVTPLMVLEPDLSANLVRVTSLAPLIDTQSQGSLPQTGLVDVAFGRVSTQVFALANNTGGTTSRLIMGTPLASVITHAINVPGQNGKIAPARNGDVFVVSNALLTRYRPDPESSRIDTVGTPASLPGSVSNICFDDLRDGPTLLMGDGSVREYDQSLASFVSKTMAVPPSWPPVGGPSFRRIVPGNNPGPAGSEYWFGPLTGNALQRYAPDPSVPTRLIRMETVTPPSGAALTDFAVTDRGSLLLKRGGVLQELIRSGGTWVVDTASPLNGRPASGGSGQLRISRSRSNWTAVQSLPGWNQDLLNPEPLVPETPDCVADVGRPGGVDEPDGALDNNDFVVFIDRFFSFDPRADIGAVGGVAGIDGRFDNNDFIVYIDSFFTGCP